MYGPFVLKNVAHFLFVSYCFMIRFRLSISCGNTMESVCHGVFFSIKNVQAPRTMAGTQALSKCCLLVELVAVLSSIPSPKPLPCQILTEFSQKHPSPS